MNDEVEYKIVQGYYLLGGGQENNKYDFKIYRGHPDFEKVTNDSVCWTFYQSESILTPIPAIIRVQKVFSQGSIVNTKLKLEKKRGYPILPIIKVIDNFDYELLGYMFAVHNRLQSDLKRMGYGSDTHVINLEYKDKAKLHHEVHRLKREGKNISTIARLKGISRNTVKKYLQMNTSEFLFEINHNPLQEYQNDILAYLYENHSVTARYIYNELLRKYGNNVKIGYRQFARYVKKLREKHKIKGN